MAPREEDQRPELKWRRTLRALLERSGSDHPRDWLNRMLAERLCGDHVLPSTIAELARTKGLIFHKQDLEVAGYAGELARVTAYRLAPESLQRARELLEARV